MFYSILCSFNKMLQGYQKNKVRSPHLESRLCLPCYSQRWHSLKHFGGHREHVLARDGYACRACGGRCWIIVHYDPGVEDPDLIIALCAHCHVRAAIAGDCLLGAGRLPATRAGDAPAALGACAVRPGGLTGTSIKSASSKSGGGYSPRRLSNHRGRFCYFCCRSPHVATAAYTLGSALLFPPKRGPAGIGSAPVRPAFRATASQALRHFWPCFRSAASKLACASRDWGLMRRASRYCSIAFESCPLFA